MHFVLEPKTVIDTENGGSTELFGALFYPLSLSTTDSAIINNNSHVSVSFATEADVDATHDYTIDATETQSGVTKTLLRSATPRRGIATFVPLHVGGN